MCSRLVCVGMYYISIFLAKFLLKTDIREHDIGTSVTPHRAVACAQSTEPDGIPSLCQAISQHTTMASASQTCLRGWVLGNDGAPYVVQ